MGDNHSQLAKRILAVTTRAPFTNQLAHAQTLPARAVVRLVSADSVMFDLRAVYTDGRVGTSRGTGGQRTFVGPSPFSPLDVRNPVAAINVTATSSRAVSVLIYANRMDGRASAQRDTMRVTTPFRLVRRLTGGALHLRSARGEDIAVSAALTAAPALLATARGHHVMLDGNGTGISRVP